MESLSSQLLQQGFDGPIQSVHGETITINSGDSAGQKFTGTILVAPEIPFMGEVVSSDLREKCTIHFSDSSWPQVVEGQDTMLDANGQVWEFVKRVNNPQDQTVDFEIEKVVKNIDS
jgi:hypothetical protein